MNLFQIDVVIGAVLSGMFAARVMQIAMPVVFWIVLGTAVWIVYTADHLVDAFRLKEQAHSQRHLFVYRHFRTLRTIAVVLLFLDLVLVVLFLGKTILMFGIAVGSLSLFYFYTLHRIGSVKMLRIPKEPAVSLFYTAGVWGGPILFTAFPFEVYHLYLIVIFGLLVLAGVFILSYYDVSVDRADQHPTFSVKFGIRQTQRIILVLCVLSISFAFFLLLVYSQQIVNTAAVIYTLMALSILLLIRFADRLRNHERFRYLIEMVFWIPGLIVLIG
jgi:hypothetical protein